MINKPYQIAAERELIRWPNTSVSFDLASRHAVALISFQGKTRKVFFPATPSDSRRGAANFLKDVRRELRNLGAAQAPKAISAAPERPYKKACRIAPRIAARLEPDPAPNKWLAPLLALKEALKNQ